MRRRLVSVGVALVAVLVGACSSGDDSSTPTTTVPTTTPPATVDPATVQLAAAGELKDPDVVIRPGRAAIRGTITGPEGPVPGAFVEIVRSVDGRSATELAQADAEGRYEFAGVLGGRYRLRAWRAPDLTMPEPVLQFIEDSQQADLALTMARFSGPAAVAAANPDPLDIGQRANLTVRVVNRSVDDRGIVQQVPRPAARVELIAPSPWVVDSSNPTTTNAVGEASWIVRCQRAGTYALSVVVDGDDLVPLVPPTCGLPPTTTTAPSPPTTTAG